MERIKPCSSTVRLHTVNNGLHIFNYGFFVFADELRLRYIGQPKKLFIDWLENNIGVRNKDWYLTTSDIEIKVFFAKHEHAILFKLTWS
jgi:hypothetical protein